MTTTYYLDVEGGNDSNNGLSFANRKLTFSNISGVASAGDTVRIMASPNETLIGNATWTQNSATVTLASAVTTLVTSCDSVWTASVNVTATADSSVKMEGTNSAKIGIASAFTTGLAAYFATGTLDLSSYQQLSFWVRPLSGNINAGGFSLRLCSDTAGVTTVNTLALPIVPWTNDWVPVTVDLGSNFGSSIQSIALYCDTDPGAMTVYLDHIIACKASSSADSLNLTSLIGKVWNLSWVASTTYAPNDIRVPTQPNRNGYRYKVTAGGGGAAGSTEPTWPTIIGNTVNDGALTWTCDSLEDTWYPIIKISGTTVTLLGRGYADTTETVSTYKRETIKLVMPGGASSNINTISSSNGTISANVIYSGGWDRSAMSSQSGETWYDAQNNEGRLFNIGHDYVEFHNLNGVRAAIAIYNPAINFFYNCHYNGMSNVVSVPNAQVCHAYFKGFVANNGPTDVLYTVSATGYIELYRFRIENVGSGGYAFAQRATLFLKGGEGVLRNNGGLPYFNGSAAPGNFNDLTFGSNVGNTSVGADLSYSLVFNNCLFNDSTAFQEPTMWEQSVYSQRHNQTAGNHLITMKGGTIKSDTAQRHTASGISWKFSPTNVGRNYARPMPLSVAKVACAANASVTVKIWCYRDNTNINGKLIIKGGQIIGVNEDISVVCSPSINTWTQSSALTFTPTEAGVVEILFQVYDGVGTTNNFWIDDISFS